MVEKEVDFLIDETGVKSSILELSHPDRFQIAEDNEIEGPFIRLSEPITFKNAHTVAQQIVHETPSIASALFDELKYWRDQGQI